MIRRAALIAVLAVTADAVAQPGAPPPYAPPWPTTPAPAPQPQPPPVRFDEALPEEPTLRYAIGAGTSGTVREKHDLAFMLGAEVTIEHRIESIFGIGGHAHLSIRNWAVIGDFYRRLDPKTSEVAYGYVFGWLAGTGLLAAGPHLMFRARGDTQPWLAIGTSLILAIDTREASDEAILGHAAYFGAGYDLAGLGFGVRVHWAPANAILFGTTGPSVFSAMGTIEWRGFEKKRR